MAKTPLGRLDLSAFGMLELPRLEAGVLESFRAHAVPRSRRFPRKREDDRLAKLASGPALKDWIKL